MPTVLHLLAPAVAAFLASLVEAVEALTVVLAVGRARGYRSALIGVVIALAVLLAMVGLGGPILVLIPLRAVQLVVGGLILLFGLRWLRKASLRAAGAIPLHDEDAAYARTEARFATAARVTGFDAVAFGAAFQIVMIEGIEVVFIVLAVGAGGPGLLIPAALGGLLAIVLVALIGVIVHRPLSRVPENTLKLVVGVMLSSLGAAWVGEGVGIHWPMDAFTLPAMAGLFALAAMVLIPLARRRRATA